MDFIRSELRREFEAVGLKTKRKNLRELPQRGTSIPEIDRRKRALLPGKRVSKNGKIYWETRKNRSDAKGRSV